MENITHSLYIHYYTHDNKYTLFQFSASPERVKKCKYYVIKVQKNPANHLTEIINNSKILFDKIREFINGKCSLEYLPTKFFIITWDFDFFKIYLNMLKEFLNENNFSNFLPKYQDDLLKCKEYIAEDCMICMKPYNPFKRTRTLIHTFNEIDHHVCYQCSGELKLRNTKKCPLCRENITITNNYTKNFKNK